MGELTTSKLRTAAPPFDLFIAANEAIQGTTRPIDGIDEEREEEEPRVQKIAACSKVRVGAARCSNGGGTFDI